MVQFVNQGDMTAISGNQMRFKYRLEINGPYALTITDVMKDIKLNIIDNINKNIT